ncbi:DUF5666 domain-containing protein [uncultured Leifsonia sp.]|uniref:DUF5666 domain-containing protein n=1 Tax=uncultured Leifsonia sp. TaxID=340359 RepID=UPI0028D65B16|nr:DUF5666 domain-containing protein [uncultured Leifsonia sp.]
MDDNQPTEPLPGDRPEQQQRAEQPRAERAPAGQAPQWGGQQPPPAQEPFYRRHGLAFAISTLVLGVVVLFGIAGVGAFAVGSLFAHSGSMLSRVLHDGDRGQQLPVEPGRPGDGSGGGSGGDGQSQRGIVRGTIASLSGSTWTIDNQRGTTITVRITSSTAFGTPGSTERAADFATGDEVIVVGTRSGDSVTATRILKLSDFPLRPPSTPGPSTPGS